MVKGNYWQYKHLQKQRERARLYGNIAWLVVLILLPAVVVWMTS